MKSKQQQFFQTTLLEWFAKFGRCFPWREEEATNYERIISEVLLQRTRAETVARFYADFFSRFPSWEKLMEATEDDLRQCLSPFGLNKLKAARLHKLAKQIKSRQGILPDEKDVVRELSLFGPYTANAFELLVLNKPSALLDVNMARLLERYFEPRTLKDYRFDKQLNAIAKSVTDHPRSKEINWAILDFAAMICTTKNPKCANCLLNYFCYYFNEKIRT